MNRLLSCIMLIGFALCLAVTTYFSVIASEAQTTVLLMKEEMAEIEGEIALNELVIERYEIGMKYSNEYDIPMDLSLLIYDIALAESLPIELAYRLIDVESNFDSTAISRVGAIGLTQLMPYTADEMLPGVTRRQLYNPALNMRLGFRYLRKLLLEFDGDMRLALLAYNRGPYRVSGLLAKGHDPANGYAHAVCRGPCEGLF